MPIFVPVLVVLGHKHSGKTTVVEGLVTELLKRGFRVSTVKHVSRSGFSMDAVGKDTWRHSEAGADPVMLVSDVELTVKIRSGASASLEMLTKIAKDYNADVVVVEGHSSEVLKDPRAAKVLCVRSGDELKEYKEAAVGEVLAYCSIKPLGKGVVDTRAGMSIIIDKAVAFVERSRKVIEVQGQLGGLDCGKCGRGSCWELAEAIVEGSAEAKLCVIKGAKSEPRTTIIINGAEVAVQPFVAEFVRRTVLAMVSTLKGTNITGKEQTQINIT